MILLTIRNNQDARSGKIEIPAEKESDMKNFVMIVLLTLTVAGIAAANDRVVTVPEISASGIVSVVGLVAGGLLVMRSRRKQ